MDVTSMVVNKQSGSISGDTNTSFTQGKLFHYNPTHSGTRQPTTQKTNTAMPRWKNNNFLKWFLHLLADNWAVAHWSVIAVHQEIKQ